MRPHKWEPKDHLPAPAAKPSGEMEERSSLWVRLLQQAGGEGRTEETEKQVTVAWIAETLMPKRGLNWSGQSLGDVRHVKRQVTHCKGRKRQCLWYAPFLLSLDSLGQGQSWRSGPCNANAKGMQCSRVTVDASQQDAPFLPTGGPAKWLSGERKKWILGKKWCRWWALSVQDRAGGKIVQTEGPVRGPSGTAGSSVSRAESVRVAVRAVCAPRGEDAGVTAAWGAEVTANHNNKMPTARRCLQVEHKPSHLTSQD